MPDPEGNSPSPTHPFTQLQEGLVALHELFCSAMEAGFTERQALILVAQMMRAQGDADD